MNRQEFYEQLPLLGKRLLTRSLGATVLFLFFWYKGGGITLWGHFLDGCMNVTAFFYDLSFDPARSVFVYSIPFEGKNIELDFDMNLFQLVMAELVTVLAMWPHRQLWRFVSLSAWCLFFLILYQTFDVVIQLYDTTIGPAMADQMQLFYEETTYKKLVHKIAVFDKLILRYWAGFPIFLFALVADYFSVIKYKAVSSRKK